MVKWALPCCHFNCVLQPHDLDRACGLYQSVGVAKLIHSWGTRPNFNNISSWPIWNKWHWATTFKIHTPPVENFEKVYHKGSVNLIPMRCTCDTHEVYMWYPCGVRVISRWLINGLLHLKSIHPLWKILKKCTTWGVWIFRCMYLLCDSLTRLITGGVNTHLEVPNELIYL